MPVDLACNAYHLLSLVTLRFIHPLIIQLKSELERRRPALLAYSARAVSPIKSKREAKRKKKKIEK